MFICNIFKSFYVCIKKHVRYFARQKILANIHYLRGRMPRASQETCRSSSYGNACKTVCAGVAEILLAFERIESLKVTIIVRLLLTGFECEKVAVSVILADI